MSVDGRAPSFPFGFLMSAELAYERRLFAEMFDKVKPRFDMRKSRSGTQVYITGTRGSVEDLEKFRELFYSPNLWKNERSDSDEDTEGE